MIARASTTETFPRYAAGRTCLVLTRCCLCQLEWQLFTNGFVVVKGGLTNKEADQLLKVESQDPGLVRAEETDRGSRSRGRWAGTDRPSACSHGEQGACADGGCGGLVLCGSCGGAVGGHHGREPLPEQEHG